MLFKEAWRRIYFYKLCGEFFVISGNFFKTGGVGTFTTVHNHLNLGQLLPYPSFLRVLIKYLAHVAAVVEKRFRCFGCRDADVGGAVGSNRSRWKRNAKESFLNHLCLLGLA